jgi:hypothetical protein
MNGKISNLCEVMSLRRYTLTEGREKGLEVIDCDNGRLRFLINVTKACDIMQMYHEGRNVSFVSKNGFSSRETDFIRRFEGGMLYTCGLDSVGSRDGYELHGTLHNTPATITRAECSDGKIIVEATVRDAALFGKDLVLKRRIETEMDGDTLMLTDVLTNEGARDEEYCLLYHINVGYPMLDSTARVLLDERSVIPRTPWSEKNKEKRHTIEEPTPCEEETCYFLALAEPRACLINERLGKSLTVSYSADTLPHFIEWKSMASGDYALGFEPCTTELDDRFKYSAIKPGESLRFSVDIAITKI